jgi:hypothetical protein
VTPFNIFGLERETEFGPDGVPRPWIADDTATDISTGSSVLGTGD